MNQKKHQLPPAPGRPSTNVLAAQVMKGGGSISVARKMIAPPRYNPDPLPRCLQLKLAGGAKQAQPIPHPVNSRPQGNNHLAGRRSDAQQQQAHSARPAPIAHAASVQDAQLRAAQAQASRGVNQYLQTLGKQKHDSLARVSSQKERGTAQAKTAATLQGR